MTKQTVAFCLVLALTVIGVDGTAQGAGFRYWAGLYGGDGWEEMEGVRATPDGGFIATGSTDSFGYWEGMAWIVKLDAFGNIEWQKGYNGGGDEAILDIRPTADGGYIGAGWTTSFGAGRSDFWVLKLSAAGDIQWQKTYGGPRKEQAWSVVQTTDGGYVVAGGTLSFGAGRADYWVIKLDPAGNIEWQKAYGGAQDDGGGGDYEEYVVRVLQDADGNYVVASDTFSFGAGESDIWLLKLDASGGILWEKAYGGPDEDSMWSFVEGADGSYIVPGVSVSFSPDWSGDLWVLKLARNGQIQWQRLYGVPNDWDEALSVGATADGGCLVGGYREQANDWDFWLLRLDAAGNLLWQRVFEYGWDWPNAMEELPDGGYIVAGVAWPTPASESDLWLLRLAPDGTIGPSCSFPAALTLTQAPTAATVTNTQATVTVTQVTAADSAATAIDTTSTPATQCVSQPVEDCPSDADLDGFGNACDCDYDQNLVCGFSDFTVLLGCFGQTLPSTGPPDDPTCAESDQDANGTVGFGDFTLFLSGFGEPPGPSCCAP